MLTDGPMIDAHRVTLSAEDDFDGWRVAARGLAEAGVPAAAIAWQVAGGVADLFAGLDSSPPSDGPTFAVPRGFVDLAKAAICHRDPERFALLYALLLKLRANRHALDDREGRAIRGRAAVEPGEQVRHAPRDLPRDCRGGDSGLG